MKVLVTGSLGLVGSTCVSFFKDKGWEVVGVDANNRSQFFGTPKKSSWDTRDIDIRDEVKINQLFQDDTFDVIIHSAAQPSHDWATNNVITDFGINALGTIFLLEATRKYCPDALFIFVSTDKVYGENMTCLIDEEESRYVPSIKEYGFVGFKEHLGLDFAGKRSMFGCSKTSADIYVQEYANLLGMQTVVFRPGCITGKSHEGAEFHGFLSYLAKCIKTGTPYRVFGNGKQVRDIIHVEDLVLAFWEVIQNPNSGEVYNMGGGLERSVSVLEAITMLEEVTGKTCLYSFDEERKGDRRWDVHDVSKFRSHYPEWDYRYSLQDIIEELAK